MNEFEMTEAAMKDRDSWPFWLPKKGEFKQPAWGGSFIIEWLDGVLKYMSGNGKDQMEEMEVKPGDVLFVRDGRVGLRPKVPFEERKSNETDRRVFSSLFAPD